MNGVSAWASDEAPVTSPTTLAAIDVGTNSLPPRRGPRRRRRPLRGHRPREGDGAPRLRRRRHEAAHAGRHPAGRGHAAPPEARSPTSPTPPVRAVATSAVREAENHDEFVRRAREEAGVEIEVVSGIEEARLIHLGVLQSLPVFERRLLLCDIGGGSTELLIGQRGDVLASRSLKLGAVRLTNRFFPGDRLHPSAVSSCRTFVRSTLAAFTKEVEAHGFEIAVGSSGTILALAAMASAAAGGSVKTLNAATLSAGELAAIVKRLVDAPVRRRPGQDPGPRRPARRHHPRRRPHPRERVRRLRHRRDDGQRPRPPRGRAARHHPAHPRRLAPPPPRRVTAQRPRPRRAVRRGARALGPRRPPRPRPLRRHRRPCTASTAAAASTSRRRRCWPTWGCSCPTASTTCTRTT